MSVSFLSLQRMIKKLVLIPSMGKGHLVSTLQFAKHLLNHTSHDQLSITILIIPAYDAATTTAVDAKDDDHTNTQVQHIHLPKLNNEIPKSTPEIFTSTYISSYKPLVKDAITSVISSDRGDHSVQLVGLVVDLFCTSMIDVGNEFNVPSYLFVTSGAALLGFLYYLQDRYDRVGTHVLKSSTETKLSIPCYANAVPVSSLPSFALYKDGHNEIVAQARRMKETKGIFINTFVELESHAVKSLTSLDDEGESYSSPPIYAVGPIIDLTSIDTTLSVDNDRSSKVIKWLDAQPPLSVLLLCFGSMGSFRNPLQLKEIALGLERSGQRFLWSVRQPQGNYTSPSDYDSYDEILPPGYIDRIGDRGMLCGWISQVKVLAHPATGGFVSHCGWNSILESFWFGVPIVTWPLCAEQQINAFQLVKDLGLAIELTLDYRKDEDNILYAGDIERAVARVMDKDSEVRKRVKDVGDRSRRAMSEGGSSFLSYGRLLDLMCGNMY